MNHLASRLPGVAFVVPVCLAAAAHAQDKPPDYPNKPGALSYGSQGPGTTGHIGWERFKHMAGVDIVHVPYKGAALAVIDVMSGQIQMTFSNTVTSGVHLTSGKMRGLALTGFRRTPLFPDMPTVSESGVPGFELSNSYAYFAFQPFALRARNCVTSRQPSRLGTPPRTAPASMPPNTSS